MNKKGFTLLELLVVVLIIGILASLALPQYQMAVEKSRSAEVLMNLATIKREIGLYITANGLPSSGFVPYKDFATVELSGGEWSGGYSSNTYIVKQFTYYGYVLSDGGEIQIGPLSNNDYFLFCTTYQTDYNDDTQMGDGWYCSCITNFTDNGSKICKAIYEPLGFKYVDDEW